MTKVKKLEQMTPEKFLKVKRKLDEKKDAFLEELNKEFLDVATQFCDEHTIFRTKNVYERVDPKFEYKYTRFVAYSIEPLFFPGEDVIMIRAGGWWLDDKSIPSKWEEIMAYGAADLVEFKQSENQEHHPHPDRKKMN